VKLADAFAIPDLDRGVKWQGDLVPRAGPSALRRGQVDNLERHDLVGFAAVDDEVHRLLGVQRAVRLALGVTYLAIRHPPAG
jgi:hypothetical protein